MNCLNIICFGDVVGRGARRALKALCPQLREDFKADLIIANGENAAGGVGLDTGTALELRSAGIDIITLGDHAWQKKDFFEYLDKHTDHCIRPANYPAGCPGRGWTTFEVAGHKIGIINLLGRIFTTNGLDCPFKTAEKILNEDLADCRVIICDIHAEATSEKVAFAKFFDGRFSLIFGTHTHVQTADERILTGGTAYITDLGMCGSENGVIGMDTKTAISRFLTGIQYAYKIAKGDTQLSGIFCKIDLDTGKAISIERLAIPYTEEK